MTNQEDAVIAEIVGYTFYEDANYNNKIIAVDPGKSGNYGKQIFAKDIDDDAIFLGNRRPPTFTSNASFKTDGIVLEWVQGQDGATYGGFVVKLSGEILRQLSDGEMAVAKSGMFSLVWLKYYKPGDYAQAVYVLHEERDDDNM